MLKEVKIYNDWKEFLSECDLGHWECYEDDLHIEEITIEEFLNQPDLEYVSFEIDGKPIILIFNEGSYKECFVEDDGMSTFYVIYNKGVCTGKVYFSKKEAEEAMKEKEG